MVTSVHRPADRYGDKPRRRRWTVLLIAAGLIATVGVLVFLLRASDAQIRASMVSWEEAERDTMTATIEVVRRPDTTVTCDLVAMDLRQLVVGQTDVVVPPSSERRIVLQAEIPLQGDAVAASIRGCHP